MERLEQERLDVGHVVGDGGEVVQGDHVARPQPHRLLVAPRRPALVQLLQTLSRLDICYNFCYRC